MNFTIHRKGWPRPSWSAVRPIAINPKLVLVMNITTIILTLCCLQLSAAVYSQKISLKVRKAALKDVLLEIRKQSGYNIIYSSDMVESVHPVTLHVKEASLENALRLVLANQSLRYEIVENTILIQPKEEETTEVLLQVAQQELWGKVTDSLGQPLYGANVRVVGLRLSTTTNHQGEFTLRSVPDGAVLHISFVGYEAKEIAASGQSLNIILRATTTALNEAVVTTAYGLEKRTKELGYSVAKITGEDLNRTNPGNILTGLTGRVSGLVISNQGVGMDPANNIMLRGIRSINSTSNNQPLFILNGSPLSFGSDHNASMLAVEFINNLNPNDVENITVLKGANGSAIYGPEGVNGVIIINTKRGDTDGLSINFRTSTTLQNIDWNQRQVQDVFGSGFIDYEGNTFYNPTGQTLWGPAYNGELVQLGRTDENGEMQMVPYQYNTDRQKFWDVARHTQNNLSISESDARSDFYLGLNHTDQAGLLPGDKQNRYNMLLNTGRRYKDASIRFNFGYTYTTSDKGPSGLNTDMIPGHVPLSSYSDYLNDHWADRNHYWSDESPNPYEAVASNRTIAAKNAIIGSLELKVNLLPWLSIIDRPGITYEGSYRKSTSLPQNYSEFAKELGANGRWISYQDKLASLTEGSESMFTVNNDFLISTVHQPGDFSIKTTLGNTIRQSHLKNIRVVAGSLSLPVYNLQFGIRDQTYPTERSVLSRFYSFFGTALVGYKDKLFVELTGRNDWDSKLAVQARGRNFYAGVNTSLVLTELFPELKGLRWLSNARLRGAINRTANMNISPHQTNRTLEVVQIYGGQVGYDYMSNIPNPYIQPERVFSQEYGGSFSFFQNVMNFDVAYYRQRNSGLILNVINSVYSGAPTIDNAGVYDNYGWEFDLNIKQLFRKSGQLKGQAGFRFALNDNKVVSLPDVYDNQILTYAGSVQVVARTGSHAYEFSLRDWRRDSEGRIIVDRETGMPQMDFENPVSTGRTLPRYTASANFNLEWKNFSFYALADYRGGNHQYNESGAQGMRMGSSLLTTQNNREPFVIPNSVYDDGTGRYIENNDVKIRSVYDYFLETSFTGTNFLTNANFFTLRELSLTYDLHLQSKKLKRITFGVYGKDLLRIYAEDNIYGDPQLIRGPGSERTTLIGNDSGGVYGDANSSYDRLPGTVQYGFVVNLGF